MTQQEFDAIKFGDVLCVKNSEDIFIMNVYSDGTGTNTPEINLNIVLVNHPMIFIDKVQYTGRELYHFLHDECVLKIFVGENFFIDKCMPYLEVLSK